MSAIKKLIEAELEIQVNEESWQLAKQAEAELAAKDAEIVRQRAFVKELFELSDWPDGGDIDGFDFQDAAVKHGILIPEKRAEPCGEGCSCNVYYSDAEWAEGITCYRIADALKGKPAMQK